MNTSYWSAWPGPLPKWRANYTRVADDDLLDLPIGFLADNRYFQLATRPLFQLWDNEPLTVQLQAQASAEQIRLFAVYVTDGDIENGGFWQWLLNSYSCLYPSLLEGHRMLGLAPVADLVEDAVRQVFPDNSLPLDHDARNAALDLLMATPRHRRGCGPARPARPDLPLPHRPGPQQQQRGAAPHYVPVD